MPDQKREDIEEQLLAEMQSARRRYQNKENGAEEYLNALRRLNNFLIHGTLGEDSK